MEQDMQVRGTQDQNFYQNKKKFETDKETRTGQTRKDEPLNMRKKVNEKNQDSSDENNGEDDDSGLGREERIDIAVDKATLGLCDLGEDALMMMVGQVIGTSLAFAFMPATVPNYLAPVVSKVGIPSSVSKAASPAAQFLGNAADKTGISQAGSKAGKAIAKNFDTSFLHESDLPSRLVGANVGIAGGYALNRILPEKSREKNNDKMVSSETDPDSGVVQNAEVVNDETAEGFKEANTENSNETENGNGIISTLAGGVKTGAKVLKSIPPFIYPSIQNATPEEEALIIDALDSLPLKDVTRSSTITMSDTLRQERGAAGLAYNLGFDTPIAIDRELFKRPFRNQKTVMHEIGHAKDNRGIFRHSLKEPWGKGKTVSEYAKTNHKEDFAEAYAYFYHPHFRELGEANAPEKMKAMEELQQPTMYDVVMDRKEVREAGKFVAKAIDKVPGLRQALTIAGNVMGPLAMSAGSRKLKSGIAEGDKSKEFNGKMDVAQGLAYMSGLFAPAGLGINAMQWMMNRQIKKGDMTPEEADKIAGTVLSTTAGPLGLICQSTAREVTRTPETESVRNFLFEEKEAESIGEKIKSAAGMKNYDVIDADTGEVLPEEDTKLTWDDRLFIAKVGAGAASLGTVGTAAGFISGEVAGAVIGGAVAGPPGALTGAFLGKVGGGLLGTYAGSRIGAQAGRKIDETDRNDVLEALKNYMDKYEFQTDTDS
jgi:hypothetical protein